MSNARAILVAVVDDDPSVLEAVENLLLSGGYLVESFDSAEAFLKRQEFVRFDCLVSDMGLPGINGFDLQTEIGLRTPQMPVILVTGRDGYGSNGVHAFNNWGLFRKPFDAEKLLAAIGAATRTTTV
jgi:FixJ family two-component response regulator